MRWSSPICNANAGVGRLGDQKKEAEAVAVANFTIHHGA